MQSRLKGAAPQRPWDTDTGVVVRLVEAVLAGSSRRDPADARLRDVLKRQRGLTPELSRQVAEGVFACLRWQGWLDQPGEPGAPTGDTPAGGSVVDVERRLRAALALQARFDTHPASFPDEELLLRAMPGWAVGTLGGPMSLQPARWARSLQAPPRLWLRARPGRREALAAVLGEGFPSGSALLPEAFEYLGRRDLFATPEFHGGEFEIQDVASQAVARICGPKPGETWWDACAGEGGKTLALADQMENKGLIWATDRAGWRLQRLKRRAARARVFNYRAMEWDGERAMKTRFDGILVDAPCSGLGTWQRNPQARWTTTERDVTELAAVQEQLLTRAAAALKRGGRLIYAVCTLTRAETEEVVEATGRACPELQPEPVRNPLRPGEGPGTPVWMLPEDGGNGMFVAVWRKPR